MAKARKLGNSVRVVIVALGDTYFYHVNRVVKSDERLEELRNALKVLDVDDFTFLFNDKEGLLDTVPMKDIITKLDREISSYNPTMVFIPYPSFHQDHKIVFDASFASLRPTGKEETIKLIAMYEYPFIAWNYEHLNGGNLFLDISDTIDLKLRALSEHKSQLRDDKSMISPISVKIWAEKRGFEIGRDYAEAFKVIKQIL